MLFKKNHVPKTKDKTKTKTQWYFEFFILSGHTLSRKVILTRGKHIFHTCAGVKFSGKIHS